MFFRVWTPRKHQISSVWVHQETDINGSAQREPCINGKSDTKLTQSTTSRHGLKDVELSDATEAELLPDLFRRGGSASSESTREGPEICDELRETRSGEKYVWFPRLLKFTGKNSL